MYKDKLGRWRTQSLFKEFYTPNREEYPPVFTLKEYDDEGLPSMRQLFLKHNDPTGYAFAKENLGSYEHWRKLCSVPWFQEHLAAWKEELDVKLMSAGLVKLREMSQGNDSSALKAAIHLISRGWEPKKGRPKKEDIDKAIKAAAGIEAEVEDDLQRIRLVS